MPYSKTDPFRKKYSLKYVEDFFADELQKNNYVRFHKIRYQYLLNLVSTLSGGLDTKTINILDVGPMHQTKLIRAAIDKVVVDTIGTNYPINDLRPHEKHTDIDLNYTECYTEDIIPKYDIIVFSEVLEHLYTKPEIVISFLSGFLKNNGYIIIQTPNGLAIHHRLKLLFGIQPYQLIDESRRGHYREYSLAELSTIIENCKLQVHFKSINNYFSGGNTILHKAFIKLEFLMPKNFRDGITIIGQKKV